MFGELARLHLPAGSPRLVKRLSSSAGPRSRPFDGKRSSKTVRRSPGTTCRETGFGGIRHGMARGATCGGPRDGAREGSNLFSACASAGDEGSGDHDRARAKGPGLDRARTKRKTIVPVRGPRRPPPRLIGSKPTAHPPRKSTRIPPHPKQLTPLNPRRLLLAVRLQVSRIASAGDGDSTARHGAEAGRSETKGSLTER